MAFTLTVDTTKLTDSKWGPADALADELEGIANALRANQTRGDIFGTTQNLDEGPVGSWELK